MDENINAGLQRVGADYLQRQNKPTRPGTYTPSPLQRAQTATQGALDPRPRSHSPKGARAWEWLLRRRCGEEVWTSLHGSSGFSPSDQLRVPSRLVPPESQCARSSQGCQCLWCWDSSRTKSKCKIANHPLAISGIFLSVHSQAEAARRQGTRRSSSNYIKFDIWIRFFISQ